MSEATWVRQPVKITTGPAESPGESTVSGFICPDVPGLAVTPSVHSGQLAPGNGWSITHLGSGREIAAGLTEKMAKRRAVQLEPLANWGADSLDLVGRALLFADVQQVIGARWGGLVPKRLRRSRAAEAERKARQYLAEALNIHENRADDANASRIRATLAQLDR